MKVHRYWQSFNFHSKMRCTRELQSGRAAASRCGRQHPCTLGPETKGGARGKSVYSADERNVTRKTHGPTSCREPSGNSFKGSVMFLKPSKTKSQPASTLGRVPAVPEPGSEASAGGSRSCQPRLGGRTAEEGEGARVWLPRRPSGSSRRCHSPGLRPCPAGLGRTCPAKS